MNLDQLTIKSQEAIQRAQQIALGYDHQAIETSHLLKGILEIDKNVTPYLFKKLNLQFDLIQKSIDNQLHKLPKVQGSTLYPSQSFQKAISKATIASKEMNDDFVSIEHLIIGILETNDDTSKELKQIGINKKQLIQAITDLRKGSNVKEKTAEDQYNALNKYAINLNDRVLKNKLDPVIGRDDEIRRVLQILSRRTKNNPILIGEPGVGKTAIAEGIAHRIVNGDIPENLKNKLIFSLDMGNLIAGAKYKGEFEERLKSVIKEVTNSNGNIILFIDEIHTLVGAGGGEGAMDAANILKPALARGELRAIGATTLKEYQKYFEKDKALERRFQQVMIDEPNTIDAISILRGIKEKYESHHKVRIKDEAIIHAVELSQRYITDRFLPDKAIDLIDEASAKMRMEINSMPIELDELERKIRQMEIEREAIKRENDKVKLENLNQNIANLNEKRNNLKAKWESEKSIVDSIQKVKHDIENLKASAIQYEREGKLEKVAEIRYGKLVESEKLLKQFEEKMQKLKEEESTLIKEEVDTEDIAAVVSRWTGIPISKMLKNEKEKLLCLENELHKRVIGQEDAIEAVSNCIRRSRAGLSDENKPIGSFLFLGTTGVGKTELAKSLAELLFDNEQALTRIDMSEYQERHAISRLIGAPPGYVGYDEGGQLTEAVRRKPYSVILLDEIEKAHPDVFNILLQVLDDGRLTDNKGRVANFKNTIIIMTSNFGSDIIHEKFENLNENNRIKIIENTKLVLIQNLKQNLKPEFINRINEIIMFLPLSKNEIKDIIKIQFNFIKKLAEKQKIKLHITTNAIEQIAKIGYDPQFGARPIKRLLEKEVLNQLSKNIIASKINLNETTVFDFFDEQFIFRKPLANENL